MVTHCYSCLVGVAFPTISFHFLYLFFVFSLTLKNRHSSVSCVENEILYIECQAPKCGMNLRSPSLELLSAFESDRLKNSAHKNRKEELKLKNRKDNFNNNGYSDLSGNSQENIISSDEGDNKSVGGGNNLSGNSLNVSYQGHLSNVSLLDGGSGGIGGGGGSGILTTKSDFGTKVSENVPSAVPAYPGYWPWHVKIVSNGVYLCEATLISLRRLLTQGPCWSYRSLDSVPETLSAIFGSVRLYSGDNREAKSVSISTVIGVPRFDGSRILELKSSILPNAIARPICVGQESSLISSYKTKDERDLFDLPCFVTGFNVETDRLESRRVQIVPFERCSRNASNSTKNTKFAHIDRLTNRICVHLPVDAIDTFWAISSAAAAASASISSFQKTGTRSSPAVGTSGFVTTQTLPASNSAGSTFHSSSFPVTTFSSTESKTIQDSSFLSNGTTFTYTGKPATETGSLSTDSGRHLFCIVNNSNWNLFATETSLRAFESDSAKHDFKSIRRHFRYFDILKLYS